MTDLENVLDEIDGRLTAVTVKYPGSKPFVWSYQKHVQHALKEPKSIKPEKLLNKGRAWLHEMAWKHPIFRDEFMRMVSLIEEFEKSRSVTAAP